jgi:acetoacetyl-CoA synthetase
MDFMRWLAEHRGIKVADYTELWKWSVAELDTFWGAVWEYFEIQSATPYRHVLVDEGMPGARWFTGSSLNYVDHVLRNARPRTPAIIALDEDGAASELDWAQLLAQVGSVAATLRDLGVRRGDRVVGYLPNTPHAVIAFLAAASIGAVWSVCGQDYAPGAAADRFGQLGPTILVAADGYRFNGVVHDRRNAVRTLREALPTLRATLIVDHVGLPWPGDDTTVSWVEATSRAEEACCEPVPFDHPLWIVFSSGTTGRPKGIVHGHGGVLLEHLKTAALQFDLGRDDRLSWYTTTNWMMWNLVVSGLLTGAAVCTFDGSPLYPTPNFLWELAARHRITHFGTSPQYLLACAKMGVEPADYGLSALRVIGSTGSPLPAAAYPWVRDHVGAHIQLTSVTGGTDIVSGFAGGAPIVPVRAGEISAPHLGVALAAFDDDGRPVLDQAGELVVTRPMPSMPVSFWNDPDGSRYNDAYFSTYPGVWRHGDSITLSSYGSIVVHGRSDSTLNRNGVRLGSADIHAVVEKLPEVAEALMIGAEEPDGGYWMPLFVKTTEGVELDESLRERIRHTIRTQLSPRHVPDDVIAVPGIPHTRTGKKLEIPVKRLLQGLSVDRAVDPGVVDVPELIRFYVDLGRRRRAESR